MMSYEEWEARKEESCRLVSIFPAANEQPPAGIGASRTLGSLSDVCGLGSADVLARKRPEIELRRLWPSSEGVWLRIFFVFVCPGAQIGLPGFSKQRWVL